MGLEQHHVDMVSRSLCFVFPLGVEQRQHVPVQKALLKLLPACPIGCRWVSLQWSSSASVSLASSKPSCVTPEYGRAGRQKGASGGAVSSHTRYL
ncbi:hypothetical protein FKM82_030464 [Ascaphus truei]